MKLKWYMPRDTSCGTIAKMRETLPDGARLPTSKQAKMLRKLLLGPDGLTLRREFGHLMEEGVEIWTDVSLGGSNQWYAFSLKTDGGAWTNASSCKIVVGVSVAGSHTSRHW